MTEGSKLLLRQLADRNDEEVEITVMSSKSMKQSYVYIMTNKNSTALYTGVTSNLVRRVWQHKNKVADGFTSKYNITKLVYYEVFEDINEAIRREKQIKGGSRQDKINLITKNNPDYKDLCDEIASG